MLNPIHPRPTKKSQKLIEFPQPRSDAPKPASQAERPPRTLIAGPGAAMVRPQIARSRSSDQRTNLTNPAAGTIKQIPGPSLPTSFPKKIAEMEDSVATHLGRGGGGGVESWGGLS